MPAFKSELEGVALVLVGTFNPAIFQPAWFAKQKLLPDQEVEAAENIIVTPQITSWTIGGVTLTVQQERLQAEGNPDVGVVIRDLMVGTFKILEHTPITALGISRNIHFRMPDENVWHKVGHRLAPKPLWEGLLVKPGMRTLVMQGTRKESGARMVLLRVEPSLRIQPGVFVGTTYHFEGNNQQMVAAVVAEWDKAQESAVELSNTLIDRSTTET